MWQENDDIDVATDIMIPNDLYALTEPVRSVPFNMVFVQIDIAKTDITNMYNWKEIDCNDKTSLCWRSFTFIDDRTGNPWLKTPANIVIGEYSLNDIIHEILLTVHM